MVLMGCKLLVQCEVSLLSTENIARWMGNLEDSNVKFITTCHQGEGDRSSHVFMLEWAVYRSLRHRLSDQGT
jgi:hypothetical protein